MYSKEQIRRYLLRWQQLTTDSALSSPEEIPGFVRKVGCLQYDPLEPAGRNHDLVLQARCPAYRKGDLARFLYEERSLFDVWDKNMSICAVEDWPHFARFRAPHLAWSREQAEAIAEITAYLRENDCACSSDFQMESRVDWHYGPQRLAKAALECMCYAGLAVVHHKKGSRRYYALAERHIPADLFARENPFADDEAYFSWYVRRRINSVGALWNRPSDALLGARGLKAAGREAAFSALLAAGNIMEIPVEGMAHPLYIDSANRDFFLDAIEKPIEEKAAHFLGPLDNMLWDRRLIEALFGFEYRWEVYTPQAQRQYGYYVLPVLLGERFIGRIEFATDQKAGTMRLLEYWPEKGCKGKFKRPLRSALTAFQRYNRAKLVEA